METEEIMDNIEPILDQFIKTLDQYLPNNKGIVVMLGVNNNGVIHTNIGGNNKTTYLTAAEIVLNCTGDISMHFSEDSNGNGRL